MKKRYVYSVLNALEGFIKAVYAIVKGIPFARIVNSGKDVVILANGPSLNEINLDELSDRNFDIVCVNYFPNKNEHFWTIKPEYLCLIDGAFFDREHPIHRENNMKLYQALEEVDWPLRIISLYKNKLPLENRFISYEFVADKVLDGNYLKRFCYFLYDHNLVCSGAQNVVVTAGYWFVRQKRPTVYLAGLDMDEFKSYYVDEINNIYLYSSHSYGNKKVLITGRGRDKGDFSILLDNYATMFKQFRVLAEYAETRGVRIVNTTMQSYVDVFSKEKHFDSII